MTSSIVEDIQLLSDSRSAKRRSAAKRLRKVGDPAAGPALLAALQKELQDVRTWETQYQMIMAIGHCNYREALPFIESRQISGMIADAIGDTVVRLARAHDHDAAAALAFLDAGKTIFMTGALQAVAVLRMVPDVATMRRLVEYGLSLQLGRGNDDWTAIWLLRAAPGWPAEIVAPLLDYWGTVPFPQQQQIHGAVELARKRKYDKWSPL